MEAFPYHHVDHESHYGIPHLEHNTRDNACCVKVCWASKAKDDVLSNRFAVEFPVEAVGVLLIQVNMKWFVQNGICVYSIPLVVSGA